MEFTTLVIKVQELTGLGPAASARLVTSNIFILTHDPIQAGSDAWITGQLAAQVIEIVSSAVAAPLN